MTKRYPRIGPGRVRRFTQTEIAIRAFKDYPLVPEFMARGIEILHEEDGIMLEKKLHSRMEKDADLRNLFSSEEEYWDQIGINIIYALRHGKTLGYFETVFDNETWFPSVIRVPGVSRTKPKAQYLGLTDD